jgi:hypothetical protein
MECHPAAPRGKGDPMMRVRLAAKLDRSHHGKEKTSITAQLVSIEDVNTNTISG